MPHAQLTSPILRDVRQLLESGQLHQFEAADNRGEVAGTSVLSDGSVHSFVWTRKSGMKDIGSLPVSRASCRDMHSLETRSLSRDQRTNRSNRLLKPSQALARIRRSARIRPFGTRSTGAEDLSYPLALRFLVEHCY